MEHGSLNVPIEHHPTIRYMVYNGYYKVMSNIPKMGHLPTPVEVDSREIMGKSSIFRDHSLNCYGDLWSMPQVPSLFQGVS